MASTGSTSRRLGKIQPMNTADQPDLEIRSDPWLPWVPITMGLWFLLIPGLVFVSGHFDFVLAIPVLIGVGSLLLGLFDLNDTSVKLSLSREGLKDHRSETFIRWNDVAAVRLSQGIAAKRAYAFLYVTTGEGEIEIDVVYLNREPSDIALLVRERSLTGRGPLRSGEG
jgi:hypothetical protein